MILELGLWVARPDAAMTSRTRRRARAARLGRFVLEARGLEPVQLLPRHPHQRWPIGNNTAWRPQRDSNPCCHLERTARVGFPALLTVICPARILWACPQCYSALPGLFRLG